MHDVAIVVPPLMPLNIAPELEDHVRRLHAHSTSVRAGTCEQLTYNCDKT